MPDITISRTRLTYPRYIFPTDKCETASLDETDLKQQGKWNNEWDGLGKKLKCPHKENKREFTNKEIKRIEYLYYEKLINMKKIARIMKAGDATVASIINKTKAKGKQYVRASVSKN